MPSSLNSIASKCSGEKSGTHIVLLSGIDAVAGSGMLLCSGPFWTLPGLQSVAPNAVGTCTFVKSSFASSLNSTRIVRSFASCVDVAPLKRSFNSFGLLPVSIDLASSLARPRAATGLPDANFSSTALAFAIAAFCASTPLTTSTSVPNASSTCGSA
jgi:hypothetical protein